MFPGLKPNQLFFHVMLRAAIEKKNSLIDNSNHLGDPPLNTMNQDYEPVNTRKREAILIRQ